MPIFFFFVQRPFPLDRGPDHDGGGLLPACLEDRKAHGRAQEVISFQNWQSSNLASSVFPVFFSKVGSFSAVTQSIKKGKSFYGYFFIFS